MHNLARLIGQAPSELDFSVFLVRLRLERDRVRMALQTFRDDPIPKTKTKAKKSKAKEKAGLKLIIEGLRKAGLSDDQIEILMKGDSNGHS